MRYPMVIQRSWRPYASTWNAAPVSWDGNGTKTGPCYANVMGKIWEWSCRMVLDHQIWENMGETYFQTNPTLSEPCVWSSYRQNEASYVYMSIPSLSICASTCNHTKTTLGSKRFSPQLPAWIFRHRSWSHSRYWVASAIRGSAARIPDTSRYGHLI